MVFQSVKGTRDFFPEDMIPRKILFSKMADLARKYGYLEVESPAMEYMDVLTAKSGDEVSRQIFVMEQKSKESIGLRFDLTVPMTRMFIEKQKHLTKPVKWFCISRMWRYEKPQAGRLREFYQFDVESFGSDKPEADAEVISMAIDLLKSFGLRQEDVVIKVNNRYLLEGFLRSIDIKDEKLIEDILRVIDKKSKLSDDEFKKELIIVPVDKFKRILDFLDQKDLAALEQLDLPTKGKEGLENIKTVFSILKKSGKQNFVEYDPSIARGLAYYTGTVFECFDRQGKFRAILGGGRYDNMVQQFGGEATPATGFAMGDVVIELLLREKGLWQEAKPGVEYYIAPLDPASYEKAIEIAEKLRTKYSVSVDIMQRKIAKQFSYADSIGARNVIVIGEEELKNNEVTIKNMANGRQEKVAFDKIDEL